MRLCLASLACLACFGCQLLDVESQLAPARAERLWQQGQAALDAGKPDHAIALYQESLSEDSGRIQNHLSLAAAFVAKGDADKAADHLARFLQSNPEHKNARFYYAELLLKLRRLPEALLNYERAIADVQDESPTDLNYLIHCHSRVLEIAEELDDGYHVRLHRGIGMLLLAQARARLADPEGELSTESLLCKAAGELTQARILRPDEARPCWYLHLSWRQLGQQQLAQRWLREASRAAPFAYLTPTEQTRLELARRRAEAAAEGKAGLTP